jgi:hypothetical protein
MSRVYNGTTLGAPAPVHTLTPAAEKAREAVRGYAIDKKVAAMVTDIADKRREVEAGVVPANAERLLKLASGIGYHARLIHGYVTMNAGQANEELAPAVMVAGKHDGRRTGFRSVWVRGKAYLGIWYEHGGPRTGTPVGVTGVMERLGR